MQFWDLVFLCGAGGQGTTDKLFFISADTDKVPISSTFLSADTDKKPIYFFPYRPIQIPITDISYFVI